MCAAHRYIHSSVAFICGHVSAVHASLSITASSAAGVGVCINVPVLAFLSVTAGREGGWEGGREGRLEGGTDGHSEVGSEAGKQEVGRQGGREAGREGDP